LIFHQWPFGEIQLETNHQTNGKHQLTDTDYNSMTKHSITATDETSADKKLLWITKLHKHLATAFPVSKHRERKYIGGINKTKINKYKLRRQQQRKISAELYQPSKK